MRSKPLSPRDTIELSPAYIGAVMVCIESAHALLQLFISMDIATLRAIPVIVYTRMFYCVVVLTKLGICAQSPYSDVGKVLDLGSLQLIAYLQTLVKVLQDVTGTEKFSVPSTFLSIVTKVAAWYRRQQVAFTTIGGTDELLEPMEYLKTTDDPGRLGIPSVAGSRVFPSHNGDHGSKTPCSNPSTVNSGLQGAEESYSRPRSWCYEEYDLSTEQSGAIQKGPPQQKYAALHQNGTTWPQQNIAQTGLESFSLGFADFDDHSFMDFDDSALLAFPADSTWN
jgi:hypothetical protein